MIFFKNALWFFLRNALWFFLGTHCDFFSLRGPAKIGGGAAPGPPPLTPTYPYPFFFDIYLFLFSLIFIDALQRKKNFRRLRRRTTKKLWDLRKVTQVKKFFAAFGGATRKRWYLRKVTQVKKKLWPRWTWSKIGGFQGGFARNALKSDRSNPKDLFWEAIQRICFGGASSKIASFQGGFSRDALKPDRAIQKLSQYLPDRTIRTIHDDQNWKVCRLFFSPKTHHSNMPVFKWAYCDGGVFCPTV